MVREHDDTSGTPSRGVAHAARASFHNIKCMFGWQVCNMELNYVRGQHVVPHHISSQCNHGFLGMIESFSQGYQYVDGRWQPTPLGAATLHACVDNHDWDMAANYLPDPHYRTYEHQDHGFDLQDARHIYSNIGHRTGHQDSLWVTLGTDLS